MNDDFTKKIMEGLKKKQTNRYTDQEGELRSYVTHTWSFCDLILVDWERLL